MYFKGVKLGIYIYIYIVRVYVCYHKWKQMYPMGDKHEVHTHTHTYIYIERESVCACYHKLRPMYLMGVNFKYIYVCVWRNRERKKER